MRDKFFIEPMRAAPGRNQGSSLVGRTPRRTPLVRSRRPRRLVEEITNPEERVQGDPRGPGSAPLSSSSLWVGRPPMGTPLRSWFGNTLSLSYILLKPTFYEPREKLGAAVSARPHATNS